MALIEGEQIAAPWRGLLNLSLLRQVGLMLGLAGAVALGVAVVMWSSEPDYRVLSANMPERVKPEVMAALQAAGIPYRLDGGSGVVMVPADDLARARMQLAGSGGGLLDDPGFELLNDDQSFGMSARLEQARLQRALEGELARSIRSLRSVETARVHLALPQRSAFVRDKTPASASVVVRLFPGRRLDSSRIIGIQELVASGVPELMPEAVSVLDDQGRLLSISEDSGDTTSSGHYLAMTREVEKSLNQRIHELLEPMFGERGVRARVSAELDFSQVETTRENFNPQARTDPLVRSEELIESVSGQQGAAEGVPGALTNQPPQGGALSAQPNPAGAETVTPGNTNSRSEVVRNYELDRLIEHVKAAPGRVARLSVAVLLDRSVLVDDSAGAEDSAGADEENSDADAAADAAAEEAQLAETLTMVEGLVREAVGLRDARGDSIEVSAVDFRPREDALASTDEAPLWEEPMLWRVLRVAGGGVVLLILLLSVLRPTLRSLASHPALAGPGEIPDGVDELPMHRLEGSGATGLGTGVGVAAGAGTGITPAQRVDTTQERLQQARSIVGQDPKRVAQLTRAWLAGEE